MSLVVRVHRHGGPEVLELEDIVVAPPAAGEVTLRQTAIGLNYIDTYHRGGLYPVALPSGVGLEGAGVVETVGREVTSLQPGDRVAYAGGPLGAYSAVRTFPVAKLVKLPDDIADETAAALMLKGMTAYFLLHHTYRITAESTVLIHAAAGGVGSILVPWAKALGATVIGTAGGTAKCKLVKARGCDHVIDYSAQDFVEEVKEYTAGRGIDVVYDSVGRSTFLGSLDCLKRRGLMVSFGNASGKPPAVEPALLSSKGSLYLTRPTMNDYIVTRTDLEAATQALFAVIRRGVVRAEIYQRYPLTAAAKAHADLEGRKNVGMSILVP